MELNHQPPLPTSITNKSEFFSYFSFLFFKKKIKSTGHFNLQLTAGSESKHTDMNNLSSTENIMWRDKSCGLCKKG